MIDSMSVYTPTIRKYAIVALVFWTLTLVISLSWSLHEVEVNRRNNLLAGGRAFFQQAVLTRAWNANHGGVYVPVNSLTQPNPFLKTPKREIRDQGGVVYTKVNPAFMTREIAEIASRQNGIQFHITSLNPLRPQNIAKPWEVKALRLFECGKTEFSAFNKYHTLFRYMAPLKVTKNCLPCHRQQGYKVGDIRGGISVSFPVSGSSGNIAIYIGHATVYLVGLLGLLFGTRLLFASQQKLVSAMQKADAASKAKSDFLANMSHEIRTPMNGILNMLDLALDTKLSAEQQRLLHIAKQSSDGLLGILNDILDFSKIEAGRLELKCHAFCLASVLNDVINTFLVRAAEKSIQLRYELSPKISEVLVGDPLRLRQILMNLVSNGIKFTNDGMVVVKARLESAADTQIVVHFTVNDTGVGIPKDKQEKVFSSFCQADNSITKQYGGTGLGLTICRQLVHLMGGRIWLESQPGQGSNFHFSIPFSVASQEEVTACQIRETAPEKHHLVPSLKILLVDDNELNRLVASMMLTKAGAHIRSAVNGLEALRFLAREHFDLVLMDMQMPIMDGLTATVMIRRAEAGESVPDEEHLDVFCELAEKIRHQHVTIVAMTANAFDGVKEECLAAGMNDYLVKPFKLADLDEIIGRFFDQPPSGSRKVAGALSRSREKIPEKKAISDKAKMHLRQVYHLADEQIEMIMERTAVSVREVLAVALEAVEKQDFDRLATAAHTLKGTLFNLGLNDWADKIAVVELGAKEKKQLAFRELVQEMYVGLAFLLENETHPGKKS
jgi:signal transduction histidine kinase/CheY-like chemotaxis protein